MRKLKKYENAIKSMVTKMIASSPLCLNEFNIRQHEFMSFIMRFDRVFETLNVPGELRVCY